MLSQSTSSYIKHLFYRGAYFCIVMNRVNTSMLNYCTTWFIDDDQLVLNILVVLDLKGWLMRSDGNLTPLELFVIMACVSKDTVMNMKSNILRTTSKDFLLAIRLSFRALQLPLILLVTIYSKATQTGKWLGFRTKGA